MTCSAWVRSAAAVLRKDLLVEFRTRAALNALLLFAVSSLVVVSFTIGADALARETKAAFLWIVLFFSAMVGLSRSFVREEETKTADALRLAAPPEAVFVGKLLANLATLALVEVVVLPLFFGLLMAECRNWPLFLLAAALGTLGVAAGATICAALVAKASSGGALYAVLCLPILLPVLISAVNATAAALTGAPWAQAAGDLRILLSYSGIVVTASLMLFEHLWTA